MAGILDDTKEVGFSWGNNCLFGMLFVFNCCLLLVLVFGVFIIVIASFIGIMIVDVNNDDGDDRYNNDAADIDDSNYNIDHYHFFH